MALAAILPAARTRSTSRGDMRVVTLVGGGLPTYWGEHARDRAHGVMRPAVRQPTVLDRALREDYAKYSFWLKT